MNHYLIIENWGVGSQLVKVALTPVKSMTIYSTQSSASLCWQLCVLKNVFV